MFGTAQGVQPLLVFWSIGTHENLPDEKQQTRMPTLRHGLDYLPSGSPAAKNITARKGQPFGQGRPKSIVPNA